MKKDTSGVTPVIRAEKIEFSWPASLFRPPGPLLRDISFSIYPGEMVGLTGPSGTGKSTLGDILLGIQQPDHGRIYWNGHPLSPETKKQQRRYYQKIFQDPVSSFPPRQSTGDSLRDVMRCYHPTSSGMEHRMIETVTALGLLPDMLNRYPAQLSGGEMQRLALARVMMLSPRFIMADEPTSRLDISVQAHIIRLIADISKATGCAVLLISHDSALIQAVCSRCLSLDNQTLKIS